MKPGRKPLPHALHILRGNPGNKRRTRPDPDPVPLTDLAPPARLHPAAALEWQRLAPMLSRLGVLTETDTDALAAYCEAFVTWREATDALRATGILVKRKGLPPGISPAVKVANYALIQMRALMVELGMTPSARARVKVPPAAAAPVSKWGGLL